MILSHLIVNQKLKINFWKVILKFKNKKSFTKIIHLRTSVNIEMIKDIL